jgi:hypothetical protein
MVPGLAAQGSNEVYLDTAAMMLYPIDIEDAGLGDVCVNEHVHFLAENAEQEDMETFLWFDRVPQVHEDLTELVGDGDMVSVTSMTSNQSCEFAGDSPEGDFYTIQSSVLQQERRSGARKLFDLVADESQYMGDPEDSEWEVLDAPDLGDESDLDLRWSLEEGERVAFTEAVLTVRVDRLVGQIRFVSNGTDSGEPNLDSMLDAGEVFAERMEEGLKSTRMPASTVLRLVDLDENEDTSLTNVSIDHYPVFNGEMTRYGLTTDEDMESGRESIEERGNSVRFVRDHVYQVDGELAGYVLLGYYQYGSDDAAADDLDSRLDSFMGANPDVETEVLDLEWGDGTLALVATAPNEEGGTDIWYHGYLVVGDEMAYVQVISFGGQTELEMFETLMDFQASYMESTTGCDGPIPVAEIFG